MGIWRRLKDLFCTDVEIVFPLIPGDARRYRVSTASGCAFSQVKTEDCFRLTFHGDFSPDWSRAILVNRGNGVMIVRTGAGGVWIVIEGMEPGTRREMKLRLKTGAAPTVIYDAVGRPVLVRRFRHRDFAAFSEGIP